MSGECRIPNDECRMKRLAEKLLEWVPDFAWKRRLCGGVWTHIITSIQMNSVWIQTQRTPGRFACQYGSPIDQEYHGPIRFSLFGARHEREGGAA